MQKQEGFHPLLWISDIALINGGMDRMNGWLGPMHDSTEVLDQKYDINQRVSIFTVFISIIYLLLSK